LGSSLVTGEELVVVALEKRSSLKGSGDLFPQLVTGKIESGSQEMQVLRAGMYSRCIDHCTEQIPASMGFG
jgi:hypothetical protein